MDVGDTAGGHLMAGNDVADAGRLGLICSVILRPGSEKGEISLAENPLEGNVLACPRLRNAALLFSTISI